MAAEREGTEIRTALDTLVGTAEENTGHGHFIILGIGYRYCPTCVAGVLIN